MTKPPGALYLTLDWDSTFFTAGVLELNSLLKLQVVEKKKKHGYSLLKDIIVFIIIIIEVKVAPKKKREVFRNIRSIITDTHNCQMLDFFFSVRAGLSLEALKEHEENMTFQRHKHTQTG